MRAVVRAVIVVSVVILVFAGLLWWLDSALPNSSKGVRVVAGNEVRLPAGQTFVLTEQVGKGNMRLEDHLRRQRLGALPLRRSAVRWRFADGPP